jgi:ceramide glucosyltransferase
MNLLAAFSAVCAATSLVYYVAASIIAMRFARSTSSPPPPLPKIAPRVAVLKPLHGLSSTLPENLMSYLEMDYRRAEYFFGVSDYGDRAAGVPVGLKPQYPFAQITLVVGEQPECSNHKIAKLIKMAERAERAEIFVLSDADVSVDRDHLRRVVGELCADHEVGVLTCLYRAQPNGGLASRLSALFINTDFAPWMMIANAVEPLRYALGATIAIKRRALEALSGFRVLKDLLADDYYLGKFASDHGFKVKLSSSIVTVTNDEQSFSEFWKHQLRWTRTYRSTRPISLATIILHGPLWALVLLAASRCSIYAAALVVAVVAARIAMSWLLIGKVLGLKHLCKDAWLAPLKDLVMAAVWAASLFSNEVRWGGRRLRIQPDGTMREVFH